RPEAGAHSRQRRRAPVHLPSSHRAALAAQQPAADPEHIAEPELAIAILVEHRAKQATADAALLAHLLLLLAENRAEQGCVGFALRQRALPLVLEQLPRQEGEHDRREQLHQLAGLVAAQAGGLSETRFGAWQLPAQHVAEDAGVISLARLRAAEHRP